jgi:hypothetical protein
MSKFFAFLGWLVREALVVIGLLVVVLVVGVWWGLSGDSKAAKAASVAPVVAAPVVAVPVVAAVESSEAGAAAVVGSECACYSGAFCQGSRGGRYCITEAGKKQYQAKE